MGGRRFKLGRFGVREVLVGGGFGWGRSVVKGSSSERARWGVCEGTVCEVCVCVEADADRQRVLRLVALAHVTRVALSLAA